MMLRIEFSPEALRDIEETKSRLLDEFGEKTAAENIKKVMKIVRSLEQLPFQGSGIWQRYGIESDYRYIYANHNYVFYRVEDDTVKIIRIMDARRDFINILFNENN